jgi:hypothetical protein
VFAAFADRGFVGFEKLIDLELSERATDLEVRGNCADRLRMQSDEVTRPCGEPCNERADFLVIAAGARRESPDGCSIPITSEHEFVVIVGIRGPKSDISWIGVDVAKNPGGKVAGEADRDLLSHLDFSCAMWTITLHVGELDGSVVSLAALKGRMSDHVPEYPSDDRVSGLV